MNTQTEEKLTAQQIKDRLAQCIGTDVWYRHYLGQLFTQGVQDMAELCGAYWLIDAVMSHQNSKAAREAPFQVWTLTVDDDSAVLTMQQDSDQPAEIKQEIPFTDFPLDRIQLYHIDNVLLLPSEY